MFGERNLYKLLQLLRVATTFFTRLSWPINGTDATTDEPNLADAAIAFPLVGLLIGIFTATIWFIAASLLPSLVAAGLAIAGGILITGALHEDGLCDCADGLFGGSTKAKALEIMRDSRIGVYGATALIMTIGLRWTALASVSVGYGAAALIIAHMAGRAAIIIALHFGSYVRTKGLGSSVASGVEINDFLMTMVITGLLALLVGQWQGLLAAAIAMAMAALAFAWLQKRIGGYTGDGLGALEQVAEISAMLTFVALIV